MQERPTRLIAIVVLLLAAALTHLGSVGTTHAASQRRQAQKVYMPAVLQRPLEAATRDLTIVHLELFQTVQTATNSVSLIADKPTLLRVYARATGSGVAPVAEVTVHALRGMASLGTLTIGPHVVSSQPLLGDLNTTFNIDLPAEWLAGDVTLMATIDAVNTVPEMNETNNGYTAQFTFHTVAPLQITIVPITYTDTRTGRVFADPPHDPISDWLRGAFPVSHVTTAFHTAFAFTGDLRQPSEWERLLDNLTTLWAAEVGMDAPTVYYGLIPNADAGGATWFEGGVSGLGWIGQRVSLGLDVGVATGNAAGHEIGHNFGRQHAPCGNPNSVDPHYPYPNATIGVYGVNTDNDVLLDPSANYDMMSYCGPEWVSDYTYEALFHDQVARTSRAAQRSSDGLLLRATLVGDEAIILPVYRLSGPLTSGDNSGYQVQLLDAAGEVLATHPVALLQAEEAGVQTQMLVAHVPAPSGVTALRFVRQGRVLAERALAGPGPEQAASVSAEVRATTEGLALAWSRPDVPALVRYSADGQQWTTLAVDALSGRLNLAGIQLPAGGQIQVVPGDGSPVITLALD
mgnify:CR=1 FL=1